MSPWWADRVVGRAAAVEAVIVRLRIEAMILPWDHRQARCRRTRSESKRHAHREVQAKPLFLCDATRDPAPQRPNGAPGEPLGRPQRAGAVSPFCSPKVAGRAAMRAGLRPMTACDPEPGRGIGPSLPALRD